MKVNKLLFFTTCVVLLLVGCVVEPGNSIQTEKQVATSSDSPETSEAVSSVSAQTVSNPDLNNESSINSNLETGLSIDDLEKEFDDLVDELESL